MCNDKNDQNIIIFGGIFTFVLAVLQMTVGIIGFCQFYCIIDVAPLSATLTYIVTLYYSNEQCGQSIQVGKFTENMSDYAIVTLHKIPRQSQITCLISGAYAVLAALWMLTSVILLHDCYNTSFLRLPCRFPWIIVTMVTVVMDMLLGFVYIQDTDHTKTLSDLVEYAGHSLSGAGNVVVDTSSVAWIMFIIYSRLVFIWVINLGLLSYTMYSSGLREFLLIRERKKKAKSDENIRVIRERAYNILYEPASRPQVNNSLNANMPYRIGTRVNNSLNRNMPFTIRPQVNNSLNANMPYRIGAHINISLNNNMPFTIRPQVNNSLNENMPYRIAAHAKNILYESLPLPSRPHVNNSLNENMPYRIGAHVKNILYESLPLPSRPHVKKTIPRVNYRPPPVPPRRRRPIVRYTYKGLEILDHYTTPEKTVCFSEIPFSETFTNMLSKRPRQVRASMKETRGRIPSPIEEVLGNGAVDTSLAASRAVPQVASPAEPQAASATVSPADSQADTPPAVSPVTTHHIVQVHTAPHHDAAGRRGTGAGLQSQLPWSYIPPSAHRMRDQLPADEDLPPVPVPDYTVHSAYRKAFEDDIIEIVSSPPTEEPNISRRVVLKVFDYKNGDGECPTPDEVDSISDKTDDEFPAQRETLV